MSSGDIVQFKLTNQRVDKKDLDDMQKLPLESLQRALGSLIGRGSGTFNRFDVTFDAITQTLSIGPCVLYWGNDGITGQDLVNTPMRGGIVLHDPDRPAQNGNSTVDLTGLSTGRLYFRRMTADADYDNRAYYPSPGSGEQLATTATRLREWVEFAATDTNDSVVYNDAEGWYLFSTFSKSGSVVTIYPITPFGERDSQVSGSVTGTVGQLWASDPGMNEFAVPPKQYHLDDLLHTITMKLLLLEDSQVDVDVLNHKVTANPNQTRFWEDIPNTYRGIRQLSDAMDTAEADIVALQTGGTNTRTDFLTYFRDYLASRPGPLATYNAWQLGLPGEGFLKNEEFMGLSVTTSGTAPNRTWTFTLVPDVRTVYGGAIVVQSHRIYAVTATPFHGANWAAANRGRVADVQVFTDPACTVVADLPFVITGSTVLYAKVRFRKVTVDEAIVSPTDPNTVVEEPDGGFYVEVVGCPIFA